MAKVHFFCELSKLQTQSAGDEFGPQSTSVYNLTSRHTVSSTSKAYAMFEGSIRYQYDNTDASSLNAVLKLSNPTVLNGLPVKYIIYRGIRKLGIFNSTNQTTFINTISESNHIVNKITVNEQIFDQDNYLSLGLGIKNGTTDPKEIDIADNEDLDRLFFNKFNEIIVKAGDIIGEFTSHFGIDVILDGFWRKPTLDIVRNIDVTSSGSGNQITSPNSKGDKEQILHYMDIAALIGCLYRKRIDNEQGSSKKDSIYNDLLIKFINKNRVYLDIRNDNNLSLNYYDNYNDGVQLTDTSVQPAATSNETYETLGWPIYIFDDLPLTPPYTHQAKKFIETISNERKTKLKLAIANGDNTLNLCFLKHAPTYREENFELWNRWPKNEIGEARFVDLKNDGSTYSQNLELSTFQTQNDEVVSFYFRLFYAKQKETQQTGSGNTKVVSNNPIDSLFSLNEYNNLVALLSRTDSTNNTRYRAVFDGNERYVEAQSNSLNERITNVQYSGMYKTGIALDGSNIYFFAIPFCFNDSIKTRKVKVPLTEYSGSTGFLNVVASQSNRVADLGINKIEIDKSPSANLFLLNLYENQQKQSNSSNLQTYDSDTFLCITMERTEYQTHIDGSIDQTIANPFQENLHPIQLQVENLDYEPQGTDVNNNVHTYQLLELQLVGYKSGVAALDPLVLNFYCLSKQGRLASTNNAAAQVQAPILVNNTEITIGHDPYFSTAERDKYEEIVQALGLVKKYSPDLMAEVNAVLVNPKKDTLPVIITELVDGVDKLRFDTQATPQKRYRTLQINYDTNSAVGSGNVAATIFSDYPIQNIPNNPGVIRKPKVVFEGNYNSNNPSGINKTEYESLARNNLQNKTPKEIEKEYDPKLYINYPFYIPNGLQSPGDEKSIETLRGKGIGAFHLGDTVEYVPDPALPNEKEYFRSPRILINEFERNDASGKLQNGNVPYIEKDGNNVELFRIENYSQRVIRLANILAHEFGHFLATEADYLKHLAWLELRKEYPNDNFDETAGPINGGGGHLEGQPTGNRALEEDVKFSKAFIEGKGGLWEQAEKQIKNTGFGNVNDFIEEMKFKHLRPNYLFVDDPNLPTVFEIRDIYTGNFSERDFPNTVPKL